MLLCPCISFCWRGSNCHRRCGCCSSVGRPRGWRCIAVHASSSSSGGPRSRKQSCVTARRQLRSHTSRSIRLRQCVCQQRWLRDQSVGGLDRNHRSRSEQKQANKLSNQCRASKVAVAVVGRLGMRLRALRPAYIVKIRCSSARGRRISYWRRQAEAWQDEVIILTVHQECGVV